MANRLEKELIKEICANGDKTSLIPETAETGSNALSYDEGFPVATATPQSDGGIPPKRTDMNKVLNLLSKNQVFLQNGGVYTFDSTISTAIGGYPLGAILRFYDGDASYLVSSLENNNTEAPTKANIKYKESDTGKKWKCIERVVIKADKNGNNWYRLYSDGWIEQGGIVNGSSAYNQSTSITFTKTMSDTNYFVSIFAKTGRIRCGSSGDHVDIGVGTTTTTGITVFFGGSDAIPSKICWKVEGYIAEEE